MLKILPTNFKSNWKKHIKKLTFAYNNAKHRSTNYSPNSLLFGRNGRLPVDLMFDINTNKNIKNKSHSGYITNWQNAMKEVYSKVHQNNNILQRRSKSNYDKKNIRFHFDSWRKSFTKKIARKRRARETYHEVVSYHPELSIYQIKPENGGNKTRTVHRNLLMNCNDLPVETQSPYSTLSTSYQKPKKLTSSSSSVDSSCSNFDSEFEYVLVKRKPKKQYI